MIRRSALILLTAVVCLAVLAGRGVAQDPRDLMGAGQSKTEAVLDALGSVAAARADKREEVRSLTAQLETAPEGDRAALEQLLKEAESELARLEQQFDMLATGGAARRFSLSDEQTLDLGEELEQLIQPLIVTLKLATAESRRREMLRHSRFVALNQLETATRAVESTRALARQNDNQELAGPLLDLVDSWEKRRQAASDLITSIDRQLESPGEGSETALGRAGEAITAFLHDRGLSFLFGLSLFALVFVAMQFVRKSVVPRLPRRIAGRRSFRGRLIGLLYQFLTALLAIWAMLYVFNARNDWLLLAVSVVFLLAAGWVLIKMLPNLVEQITLLLNLGAVQQDERVVFNGVPWLVTDLSYYTTLENPLLSAGTVTLPVRELIGLHSRPLAPDEEWFPCREGEWIRLSDGHYGQVVFQSPEMVQVRLPGGAVITYTTQTFLDLNPINLSRDFRVELEVGIDYRHQAAATGEVPEKMRAHVERGLRSMVAESDLVGVQVDFLRAGPSSLDYEVEADIRGRSAHLYEDIERAMARLVVEACNENNWTIPFPQLTVHASG